MRRHRAPSCSPGVARTGRSHPWWTCIPHPHHFQSCLFWGTPSGVNWFSIVRNQCCPPIEFILLHFNDLVDSRLTILYYFHGYNNQEFVNIIDSAYLNCCGFTSLYEFLLVLLPWWRWLSMSLKAWPSIKNDLFIWPVTQKLFLEYIFLLFLFRIYILLCTGPKTIAKVVHSILKG